MYASSVRIGKKLLERVMMSQQKNQSSPVLILAELIEGKTVEIDGYKFRLNSKNEMCISGNIVVVNDNGELCEKDSFIPVEMPLTNFIKVCNRAASNKTIKISE